MNFAPITLVTLFGIGIAVQGYPSVNVYLNRDKYVSPPSFQPFSVRCSPLPNGVRWVNYLQWLGPDGKVIDVNSDKSQIKLGKRRTALELKFENPSPNDSGKYSCIINFPQANRTSIDIHFQGINECLRNNFGCSHKCVPMNAPELARCECPLGYELLPPNNKTCIDIDECMSEELNRCFHECHNKDGSYECSCFPGYVQVDEYRCEGCRKNSYRMMNDKFCTDCPENSVTDGPGKSTIQECKCLQGYTGDPSQQIPCTDIDECEDNNFNCSHECVNTPGSGHCSCPKGYELDTDGKTCIDVDECSVNNGGCEGKCENIEGSFRCSCGKGYELLEPYKCNDIDECANLNGGCDQLCNNFRGGHYCSCRRGFKLDRDQRSCIANRCPRVAEPSHSTMKCYKNRVKKNAGNYVPLGISDSYANGTACYVTCEKGYKASSKINYMLCYETGEWSVKPPTCIAKQCGPLPIPTNGAINPRSCAFSTYVGRRCFFTCRRGYKLKGTAMLRCGRNKKWMEKTDFRLAYCEPIKTTPHITCADDITAVLEFGKNKTSIIVPGPQTVPDVGMIEVSPDWVRIDTGTTFTVGITEITFTARSSLDSNLTASCLVTVNVIDDEPPTTKFCPESFTAETNSSEGVTVYWTEPVFTDNVAVQAVTSNTKPGDTLLPGVYLVRYSATDKFGNEGICEFTINVTSPDCGYPNNPANGRVDCNDWVYGRLCTVICDTGYMLYPPEPSIFVCDDSGTWEPTKVVHDCMKTHLPVNGTCSDGYELIIPDESSEEICVKCPIYLPWSEQERLCSAN